jgi:hypothetical protein
MTNNTDTSSKFAVLQHGDLVDVHSKGKLRYSGYVDDTMPSLHILWVREVPTGERKMVSTDEYRIVRH